MSDLKLYEVACSVNFYVEAASEDDVTDWGNSSELEAVGVETTQPLDQLMADLVKHMDKVLNGLDFVSLDTLSRIYQRIKSVSLEDEI